jgi:predicted RNase H-like HicB family nuclease
MATKTNTPVPRKGAPKVTFRCQVVICPAEEGGFTSLVPALSAAYSQGDTVEQTLERTQEAVTGVVKFYLERGMEVPFDASAKHEPRKGDVTKWIVVHV